MWGRLFGPVHRKRQRKSPGLSGLIDFLEDRTLLSASAFLEGVPDLAIDPNDFATDSILVRYKDGYQAEIVGPSLVNPLSSRVPGLSLVHLSEGVTVVDALATYRSDPNVLYAEPNYRVSLQLTPDDAQFNDLWGMNNTEQTGGTFDADIDAVEAWDFHTGDGNIVVAVIDTGVDYTHEDLAANIWVNPGEVPNDGIDNDQNGFVDDIHGYDFAFNNSDPMDDHNHGTHVAGTIGAVGNNGIGVAGVNWNVQIMAVKFLDASGGGSISGAIAAIEYAVDNGAHLSNNSWGLNGSFSQALHDAVEYAHDAGHIFVAAAGNGNFAGVGLNNDVTPFWPANHDLDNVVSVAALDHNDQKATFSNYGATTVDVGAPGVGILSTTIGDTYSTFSGTSMATPHAAGLISLIWDQNPQWSWQQVLDRFYETVEPVAALDGITVTGSRINAGNALGPDETGPKIRFTEPEGFIFEPISSLRVQASEALNPDNFGPQNILSFTGPLGEIAVTDVVPVPGENNRVFEILFPLQTEMGPYRLTLGGGITDVAGNLLDQDGDGFGAEPVDDTFDSAFDLVPFFSKLDFGTGGSPIEPGFQRATPSMSYNAQRGFGWTAGTIDSRDRGATSGDDLERDFNHANGAMEFAIDVPTEPALYDVTITMGDGSSGTGARDDMGILIEGAELATVTTQPGQYVVSTFQVMISDGQFNLRLEDQGGSDSLVLINGLVVEAVGPDLVGPRVVSTIPGAQTTAPLDRFIFTFDEPVDPSTFTADDVISLTGPSGAITPTEIREVAPNVFEVLFAPESELGDYAITIGPDIRDLAGNMMDQDLDRVNGEAVQDQFSAPTEVVPIVPIDLSFDFGTTSSPVASGFTQVSHATSYSSSQGYGWLSGSIDSRDRGAVAGNDETRDFNHTTLGTFAVDVPSDAVYLVTVTMGDGQGYVRDEMGVFLEGEQVDTVTADGINYEVRTYAVRVTDGQLTLLLDDLGGDPLVMINSLRVATAPPDNDGPQIVSIEPAEALGTLDEIIVEFNETIDATTFTPGDIASLTAPSGNQIPVLAVSQITGTRFAIQFDPQTELGTYDVVIGPEIRDLVGNRMDQDGDGIHAEVPDDQFAASLNLAPQPPFERHFDFGTAVSPVAAGHTQVLKNSNYNASAGFGWTSGSVDSRDRGASTGDDASRDFNYTQVATFVVDVPVVSSYEVTVTMGDGLGYVRDQMGVYLEGTLVDSVTADGQSYAVRTYTVTVTDGQLTILFDDLGGDPLVMINALSILEAGPDTTGPQVIDITPTGEIPETFDRFVVTFDEAIDAGTFTVDDVELDGRAGTVSPTAINTLSGGQFELVFDPQTTTGDYTLSIGPEILDLSGNAMDQDGDGTNGEPGEDEFEVTVHLIPRPPFEGLFDFGTATSPLEAGYTKVEKTSNYTPAAGFGWISGSVDSRDRGSSAGDDLTRDFNFTKIATFVVDVPVAGDYEVTVTLGDGLGYVRDQMGIFLEVEFFDSVTTDGVNLAVRTYTVTVTDGQLTLLLDDLGGDPNVMINGLEVREVAQAGGSQVSGASLLGEGEFESFGFAGPDSATILISPPQNNGLWIQNPIGDDESRASQASSKPLGISREDRPVLDQVFSSNLPALFDALEGLGDLGLRSALE